MKNEDISKLKIDKGAIAQKKKRNGIRYLIALLLIAAILYFLYTRGIITPATEVEVANVVLTYPSQAITLLNASGYVVAQRKAAVASKVTGRLVSLSVEEGSKVKKGQVIAELENADVLAARDQASASLRAAHDALNQVKADLEYATLSFNRQRDLLAKEAATKAAFDSAESLYNKAKATVAAAESQIKASEAALRSAEVAVEYALIRAPFDAVVLTKNADIGDIVTPLGAAANAKAAVVTIADMDSLQVETDVSESNIHQIQQGQPCEIQLDALPDERFVGEVHIIVPTADRAKASILVKVRFIDKDARILPEMSARVAFLSRQIKDEEKMPHPALNPSAIQKGIRGAVVFLIKADKVVETPVKTGEQLGDMIEIISGVNPGDRVVLKPLEKIRDGVRVKVPER
jgi:RND family efflux transporter MFP subunit